jgi:hypothetical protein
MIGVHVPVFIDVTWFFIVDIIEYANIAMLRKDVSRPLASVEKIPTINVVLERNR